MEENRLSRRDFSKLSMAAFGGLVAGIGANRLNLAGAAETTNLLAEGANVCRGLNQCKGHKGESNTCAGTGSCATAKAHGCNGDNDCKAQGGCGEHPGENACKGQGKCNVPLTDGAWAKARANFEKSMKAAGKKFGPAPAKK